MSRIFGDKDKLRRRLMNHVSEDSHGCLVWNGTRVRDGYGLLYVGYRDTRKVLDYTHRIAFWIENGDIPVGLSVLHHCDNPPCVNIAHLFLGSQRDNMLDMWSKGRNATGSKDLTNTV